MPISASPHALDDAKANRPLYLRVLAPTFIMVCLIALLGITSVKALSGVRAYVGGESLWSKARSTAVLHLTDYAVSREDVDYNAFEASLAVPLGDKRARLGMMQAEPDMPLIRQGLVAGGNHPDDVDVMIALFRHFGDQPMFKDAVQAWVEGDALMDQLQTQGHRLHDQVLRGALDAELDTTVAAIRQLNSQLAAQELRFRNDLSHAARLTETLLMGGILLMAALLLTGCIWIMHRSLKRQTQYQQTLRQVTARWELAAKVGGLGMYALDVDSDTVDLDARTAAMHGLAPVAITLPRDMLRERVVALNAGTARQQLEAGIKDGRPIKIQYQVRLDDGSIRHLEAMGSLNNNRQANEGRQLVAIVRDTTDEHLRLQLAAQRDAAQRVAQAQREFLARLSHELRTPLNAILGFAQLLNMDAQQRLSSVQKEQVQWIFDAGQQLLALVEDVLDLTKVEAGEISMSITAVPLQQVLRNSMNLVEGASKENQVTLWADLPEAPISVQADAQRLQQVFINLLTNGCKYNKPGGWLRVRVRQTSQLVSIDFQDDGIGLSATDCEQLFQPFKRVHVQERYIEGTGLGLYIVKQLLEHMGGQITVSSEPGQGSVFTVTLAQSPSSVSH